MPKDHVVEQGEHLSSIAEKHGFADYKIIWDDAANAALKEKRKNPHVLFPGDVVKIPDRVDKKEPAETKAVHTFKVKKSKLKLRIIVQNLDRKPLAETDCVLNLDGATRNLKTDASGLIEAPIPRSTKGGSVKVVPLEIEVPMKLGELDPVDELSGQKARLNNLGYDAGDVSGPEDDQFRSAVEEFQCDNEISPVTGVCDADTQDALVTAHGS